jgi:hypothetical protein
MFDPWTLIEALCTSGGVVLVWEGFVKPRRDRASVARAIGEEVSLIAAQELEANKAIHSSPRPAVVVGTIATPVFDAVAANLGELRSAREVVRFYQKARVVNEIVRDWVSSTREMDAAIREQHSGRALEQRISAIRDEYLKHSRALVALQEELIPMLQNEMRDHPFQGPVDEPPRLCIVRAAELDEARSPKPLT